MYYILTQLLLSWPYQNQANRTKPKQCKAQPEQSQSNCQTYNGTDKRTHRQAGRLRQNWQRSIGITMDGHQRTADTQIGNAHKSYLPLPFFFYCHRITSWQVNVSCWMTSLPLVCTDLLAMLFVWLIPMHVNVHLYVCMYVHHCVHLCNAVDILLSSLGTCHRWQCSSRLLSFNKVHHTQYAYESMHIYIHTYEYIGKPCNFLWFLRCSFAFAVIHLSDQC